MFYNSLGTQALMATLLNVFPLCLSILFALQGSGWPFSLWSRGFILFQHCFYPLNYWFKNFLPKSIFILLNLPKSSCLFHHHVPSFLSYFSRMVIHGILTQISHKITFHFFPKCHIFIAFSISILLCFLFYLNFISFFYDSIFYLLFTFFGLFS